MHGPLTDVLLLGGRQHLGQQQQRSAGRPLSLTELQTQLLDDSGAMKDMGAFKQRVFRTGEAGRHAGDMGSMVLPCGIRVLLI